MIDVGQRIGEVLQAGGDDLAVEQNGVWHRWSDLAALGCTISAELDRHGIDMPGVRIGMMLRNTPALFASILCVIQRHGCVVTINPMLPGQTLTDDILSVSPAALIGDTLDWQRPEVVEACTKLGVLGLCVSYAADGTPIVERVSAVSDKVGALSTAPGVAIEMLSSGTTGAPRRILMDRHRLNSSLWTGSSYETKDPSKVELKMAVTIHVTPLVHIGGIWSALYNLYNGRRLALLDRFDAERWRDVVVRYRPKLATLPPSALRMVLDRNYPRTDLDSLVAIRTGTAPLDPDLVDAYRDRYGVAVLDAYGATEFAGGVAGWTIRDFRMFWDAKRGSVGRANDGVQLRVVDRDSFEPLETGAEGLLEVASDQIGKGWSRTSDIALIDADGFLFIIGRADAAINRGGFKIAPEHVQQALMRHPSIREACVVGLADTRLGQVPAAALQLTDGVDYPGDDALKTFLREQLKPYEIPVAYRLVDELPRTPSMKVSQPGVRALFEAACLAAAPKPASPAHED